MPLVQVPDFDLCAKKTRMACGLARSAVQPSVLKCHQISQPLMRTVRLFLHSLSHREDVRRMATDSKPKEVKQGHHTQEIQDGNSQVGSV